MTTLFAKTPKKDYFACIFTSKRTENADDNNKKSYNEMAIKMDELAKEQEGYIGIESTRDVNGFGITISYWESMNSIKAWKSNSDHIAAQQYGIKDWYDHYEVRVCEVKYSYSKN